MYIWYERFWVYTFKVSSSGFIDFYMSLFYHVASKVEMHKQKGCLFREMYLHSFVSRSAKFITWQNKVYNVTTQCVVRIIWLASILPFNHFCHVTSYLSGFVFRPFEAVVALETYLWAAGGG
jgi:hypothetical protein